MWKPTKEGIYIHGGEYSRVMYPNTIAMWNEPAPRYCPDDFNPVTTCPDDWRRWQGRLTPVPDGPWSLIAPDWQPGAPTVAQLGRWQWWCIDFGYGQWVCQVEESESDGHVFAFGAVIDRQSVRRSAPVQPVPGEVLWVPMEVCK